MRKQKKLAGIRPYDYDTMLGINNEGQLVFPYWVEDTDKIDGADVYNGQNSVFWKLVREAFPKELKAMFQELVSTGAWSYEKFEAAFEEHQSKWPESLRNEDAYFKYIKPLLDPDQGKEATAEYLAMCQGSKTEQRKQFMSDRFPYLMSKYNAGDALTDTIVLRGYAKSNITVKPYAAIYATVKYGSYLIQKRVMENVETILECPLENVNDTEIIIYSASRLASIGDLSGLKVGYASFVNGAKLTYIKLGDEDPNYSNPNLKTLYIGNLNLLLVLDVRNCPNLTGAPDLSKCADLKEVYFDGTAITGLILPEGGMLEVLHLPNTMKNLTVIGQKKVREVVMPSDTSPETLRLENVSSAFNPITIMSSMPDRARVRLVGFGWEFDNCTQAQTQLYDVLNRFRGLDEQGGNTEKAQVIGYIHVPSATGEEIEALRAQYPYIEVRADHTATILTYKTYDGETIIDTETIIDGADGTKTNTTAREQTAQYSYTPNGWALSPNGVSDPDALKAVTANRTVYAAYTATVRSYTVKWVNGSETVKTETKNYGETAAWSGAMPTNSEGQTATGWTPTPGTITGPTTYTTTYLPIYTVRFYIGSTLAQTSKVEQGKNAVYTGSTPVDPSGEGHEFIGWDKALTNIQSNLDVHAEFDSGAPTATTADGAYGVEWNYANSATTLTRKGLAASFTNPSPATSVSGTGSSPFDNIAPWKDMEVVNVKPDGTILHKGDAGFSMTDNDTMVYIPEFYFTAYKDTENQKWLWAISPTEKEGYVKHPGSGRYVGRYHTSGSSSAVYSKSGASPLVNTNQTNFRAYSKNKGAGWYMLDLASWAAVQMLYIVEFANFNSQSMLGTGWNTGSIASMGGTDAATYHTIKASRAHNQYRWIEDPFSNVYDWIDGFVGSTQEVYAGTNNAAFNGDPSTLTRTGIKLPSSNYIKGFGYSKYAAWAFLPDTTGGTATTYVTDYALSYSSLRPACVGGCCGSDGNYGLFYFSAYGTASASNGSLGSRLLFKA